MAAAKIYTALHVTTGTVIVKSQPGSLAAIIVNKALSGTVTITDGTVTLGVLTNGTTAPLGSVLYGGAGGVAFGTNLKVALSGTEDLTICYE